MTRTRARKPAQGAAPRLSHVDAQGSARMVDVSDKAITVREAVARGRIDVCPEAMRLVRAGRAKKGPVSEVARLAGVLAAKRTAEAIPLCHPLLLEHVDVELRAESWGFAIEARVRTTGRTGAEMEALHAVALAALTVYDMLKAADKTMVIGALHLVRKTGGASGDFTAPGAGSGRRAPRATRTDTKRPRKP